MAISDRSSINYRPMTTQVRCDHCEQQLGPTEPAVWLRDGLARVTNRNAEPELGTDRRRGAVYHRNCFGKRAR